MKREGQSVRPKMNNIADRSQKQSAAKQTKAEERTRELPANEASVAAELKNRIK